MREYLKFYIDGQWVDPVEPEDPRRRQPGHRAGLRQDLARLGRRCRQGGQGRAQGVRHLVADQPRGAPRSAAGASWPNTRSAPATSPTPSPRRWARRPSLAAGPQADPGSGHLATAIDVLKNFEFEEQRGATLIVKEPIGVCGLITPWNWPINQIAVQGVPGAGHRLHHGAEAVGGGAVLGADLHRDHGRGGRAGRVSTTWSTATGPASARRCPAIRTSTWCRSPAPPAPASRSRKQRRRRRSSGWPRNSAARARTSSSTTTTSPRAWPAASSAMMVQLRASPATRRRACWCPNARMDEAIASPERPPSRSRSAIRTARRRSARWPPRPSSTRSSA